MMRVLQSSNDNFLFHLINKFREAQYVLEYGW